MSHPPIGDVPLRLTRTGVAHRVQSVLLVGWFGLAPLVTWETVCGRSGPPTRFMTGVGYPRCPECWEEET